MRVLLSAYACEPNRGSEPEVGWQRALHMRAYANEVWVLTRANNQKVIEADPRSHAPGLHFVYYDLPGWALKLKKRAWFLPVYFVLWQWGAYRQAAKFHHDTPFDCVYHVTFASMKWGSFMGRLGIPFVIGPVAGGERAPLRLRRGMPLRGQASELLRDLGILAQRFNPLARSAFAAAERIYVTTPDSLRLIPRKCRHKTAVQLAVAIDGQVMPHGAPRPTAAPQFIFAGNLHYLKGVHFVIRALARVKAAIPAASLTIAGGGPAERWLRNVARQCGVAQSVHFAGRIPREQLISGLPRYRALVFPSLHDSGGMAALEALSMGLPVVSLDLGGPGAIVNSSCGIVVTTANAGEDQIIAAIADAIISLGSMPPAQWTRLSSGAMARANELTWNKLTGRIAR